MQPSSKHTALAPDHACLPARVAADMPGAKEKTWNAVVSLVFLAMSLTYTAFSTYQTFTGTTLTEDEARGSIQAAQVTTAVTATTSSTAVPSPSRTRRTSFLRNAEMPLLTLREGDEQQQQQVLQPPCHLLTHARQQ